MPKIDVITPSSSGFSGSGGVAQKLLANDMNVQSLRTNANTLRKDEWEHYDTAILKAAEERLSLFRMIYDRGLVYRTGNGLADLVLVYEDMTDPGEATISMDGRSRGTNDRPEYTLNYLPLPIVHADYQINARQLATSRKGNMPLDTTMAEREARAVADYLENMLVNGTSSFTYGGGTIYGLTDFPSRLSYTISANWDDSGTDHKQIINDILSMKQSSINNYYYGPWMLLLPTNYETVLDEDYQDSYAKTLRQRILDIDNIIGVQVVDKLADDNVVLAQLTSDVIRIVEALPVTNLQWSEEGDMVFLYKIMSIQVPQLRADTNGRTGIVHAQ